MLSTTFASKQHRQQQSDTKLLRSFMDRKTHSFPWAYSYPPFPSSPGWVSVNGVGYHPQFSSSGGIENLGLGVPVWFQSPDLRAMAAMTSPHQQPAAQAQETNATSSNSSSNAAAAATPSPPRSSTPAAGNSNSTTAISALLPSLPVRPMTVDVAVQRLSGQLLDAIRLCTDCLKTHAEFVAHVHFTTAETRNGLWKDLLRHKFKTSGFLHDGFNNLGRRLAYYMEQACCASQNDPALKGGEQEKQREARVRASRMKVLRAMCDEVVKLAEGASVDVLDCKEMLGLMRDMKEKLSGKTGADLGEVKKDEQEDDEEGGNSGDAESGETWPAGA